MRHIRPLSTSIFLLFSIMLAVPLAHAGDPASNQLQGVPRIKQLRNYCGPAALASVIQYFGQKTTQEEIGKEVYDKINCSTNGADMLLYARDKGFAAYSWNSNIEDVKKKLAAGVPVIVLQQNSKTDTSGHYRVLTGFDDKNQEFSVMDPYYDDVTKLSYEDCSKLWTRMGYWALLVTPKEKDSFKAELDLKNPVVHMDLSYAKYKRKNLEEALEEANLALDLEPNNTYTLAMIDRIETAMGAGKKEF